MRRLLILVAVLAGWSAGLVDDVAAKEAVRARLVEPLPRDARAGTTIRVTWTLRDAQGRPFGASGLFVRLIGRRGARREAETDGSGRLSVRVKVPPGGIKRVQFGLRGWRMYPDGRKERADMLFPLDGPVFAAAPRDDQNAFAVWMLSPLLLLPAAAWTLRRRRGPGAS